MSAQLEVAVSAVGRPSPEIAWPDQRDSQGGSLIKGEDHLRSLGLEYLLANAAFILVCGVAMTTRNLRFHMLFAFGAAIYETSFFARYYATLN
jgi:hypothetical protein